MQTIKENYKQILTVVFSIAIAIALHFKPEYRDLLLIIAGVLMSYGINLPAITFGKKGKDQ